MNARMDDTLLQVDDLQVHFPRPGKGLFGRPEVVKAVDGVSFSLRRGSTLAVVGESGSGKTTTALAVMRLAPVTAGRMQLGDTDLGGLSGEALRQARRHMQIVFQDPFSSLNPRQRAGDAVRAPLDLMDVGTPAEREARVAELFTQVGLRPEQRQLFPHQFSGGQRQRITIAMALACGPDLLIADEPTTALDVTVQQQILNLLQELVAEHSMALLLISHDLGVIAQNVEQLQVMYGGTVVESGMAEAIFARRAHPYTRGLFAARPQLEPSGPGHQPPARLPTIAGTVPELVDLPAGCAFAGRCSYTEPTCHSERPRALVLERPQRPTPTALQAWAQPHVVRCLRSEAIAPGMHTQGRST
ncbi:ABC transporter ATP-binding protein [Delftia tsuruhatensis]|uniref:ABC transporter ATP-binding protein n=1 Tax=Delftia tsuruhatensis TaxID=180282 RepID=UPI000619E2AC|nr:ABC transporter ATP-binding protein [Delftia tsuruhatensis]